jgi:subtilisin family serine protease
MIKAVGKIEHSMGMKLHTYMLSLVLLFGITSLVSAQNSYKQGIKQGTVKVKFAKAMSQSVHSMRVSTPEGILKTGIKSFDLVSEKHAARKMTRIFPEHPNPEIEARHVKHGLHLWYAIEISENENPEDVAKAYAQLGEVQLAEVEREKILAPTTVVEYLPGISTMASMPFNDPYLIDQWHYNNTEQFSGAIAGSDINLFEAWGITAGSSDIIVSVHDTGIDVNHNDLADNIWVNEAEKNGTPGVDDDNNGYIDDINGWNFNSNSATMEAHYHATHVAGTISAVNNNGIGVSGVAGGTGIGDGTRIMAIETIGGASANNIEAGYVYAADNGAVISQNSWGYTSPGTIEQSILDGIDYFIAEAGNYAGSPMKGGLVIFAAGNSGQDADFYPGYYENVVTVAAIGADFVKAGYSNYGNWVDITAPGGNLSLSSKGGVLSTLPDNKVGYLDGTSMACPHVTGVAALILANRDHQYTPDELRNQLVTGVSDIDIYNPDYTGKMGSGLTDVVMALATDEKLPPAAITDLTTSSMSQEFAIIQWTVPTDVDDGQPSKFIIYYSPQPLNETNLANANSQEMVNKKVPGELVNLEIGGLLPLTTYNFAVVSADRWGNTSVISNVITGTTNAGPAIDVDAASKAISMAVDITVSDSTSHELTILNNDEGLLRWSFDSRVVSVPAPASFANLNYPQIAAVKPVNVKPSISIGPSYYNNVGGLENSNYQTTSFETIYKEYASWAGAIVIGETDTDLTNSSATRYYVDEPGGFNLTDLDMIIKHDSTTGPIIIEIYQGVELNKKNIIYAQEYTAPTTEAALAEIHLNEQLYFAEGETFWIVFHVPSGNLYPLGIGNEFQPEYSDNCFMSFDLGNTWETLESAIGFDNYAWTTAAISKNAYLGEYLTLTPSSGEVQGNSQALTSLSANGKLLINGDYSANVILSSNDANTPELRLPLTLSVSGQIPEIYSPAVLDFGSVFNGTSKQLAILVENNGYGHWNNLVTTSSNPDFIITNAPANIYARDSYTIMVDYKPTTVGTASGTISLQADGIAHNISVYANSIEPPVNSVAPLQQTITPINLTDSVTAVITVTNTGGYPLAYYVPGWGDPGTLGEITGNVHQYGYRVLTNETGAVNPATYVWNDISTTGTNISQFFKDRDFSEAGPAFHYTVPLEFKMPFYSHVYDTVYITEQGMIDFENSVRLVNYPRLGFDWGPSGFISAFGEQIGMAIGGNVYFIADQNRFIVQYDNVTFEWLSELPPVTFQIEMLANGDINFYYKDIDNFINTGLALYANDFGRTINVMIEDPEKLDGIQLNGYDPNIKEFRRLDWKDGFAITFEYPGPDIIYAMKNASGSVLAGESRDIEVSMATASLYEGNIKRSINIISNDPVSGSIIASTNLEITSGGTPQIEVATTTINFGQVFQGAQVSEGFIIKNNGTAPTTINMALTAGNYTVTGNNPVVIPAKKLEKYVVQLPTTTVGVLNDTINITDSLGNTYKIFLAAEIMDPPDINVDLSQINLILKYGQQYNSPITIASTGIADLEVEVTGTDWLSITMEDGVLPTYNTYSWKSSKEDTTGFTFNWIDITTTGKRISDDSINFEPGTSWYSVKLPFTFNFYGQPYDTIYLAYNGMLSFTDNQPSAMFAEQLPPVDNGFADGPDNFIAPLWVSAGFDPYTYGDLSGLYYQTFDDHIIVTYSYVINVFGMGQPISYQAILFPNGTIKFQYKKEENDDWEEYTTKLGSIGVVNKGSTDFVQISGLNTIGIESGLAFALMPTQTYVAPAGTTLNGMMNFDASTVYAGVYPGAITYRTKVPGSEVLQKPVTLRVTGDPVLSFSTDTIDFQDVYVYEKNGLPVSYQKEFTITNSGVADIKIGTMALAVANPDLKLEIYYKDIWGVSAWRDASTIGDMPSMIPNDILEAKLTLTPSGSGVINSGIIITSQLPNDSIFIKGNMFIPAEISTPQDSLKVTFQRRSELAQRTIAFSNNGGYDLDYNLSIAYARSSSGTAATTSTIASTNTKPLGYGLTDAKGTPVATLANDNFNRVFSHENADQAENFLGLSGAGQLIASTRFNAGPEGFNLTHVQTFFRPEKALEGVINIEIRAGGTGVEDASPITKFDYNYSYVNEDSIGSWLTIPLPDPQILAPDEDFYLIFTYPINIDYPQGLISGVDNVAGRYMLEYQNAWYDLQTEVESGLAYLMRAAEKTYASGEWVVINSTLDSTLAVGAVATIDLEFIAANAQQGWQYADLVITSNDPLNPVVKIPMSLYLNAGPTFTNVPFGVQYVDEADTLILVVSVNDPEGNSFTVESKEIYDGLTYSLNGSELTIKITPGYDDEGSYEYSFIATDEYYAKNTMNLQVTVNNTNQAPESIATSGFIYDINDEFEEYYFTDYFTDPDNDSLTFSISITDDLIADIFTADERFIIAPKALGETTLTIIATDIYGATTSLEIPVTVESQLVLGIEQELNSEVSVYPNPTTDKVQITWKKDWADEVTLVITSITGVYIDTYDYTKINKGSIIELDMSRLEAGIYVFKLSSKDKTTLLRIIKE